jgi:WD40 repeat protein
MSLTTATSTPTRTNPYVGPRSFLPNERLYGRDREVRDLTGLIIAERIVLLHSPSGAGKTSLIQAALIPALERRDFTVEPIIRINTALPAGAPPDANRFVLSTLLSLSQAEDAAATLETLGAQSLSAYLDARDAAAGADRRDRLLIFDQFEEILTVDPLNVAAKVAFFRQIGDALRDRDNHRWALFAMREDYLAGLTPYLQDVPTRFKTTFRLDLLDPAGAQQAIQGPATAAGHTFSDAAAVTLVDDLRRVQVQRADGTIGQELGQGIEPVQLQVVCYRLWERLLAAQPPADPPQSIVVRPEDVTGIGSVDQSLEEYYAEGVKRAAAESTTPERDIRDWFEEKLITPLDIRGQVLRDVDQSDGLPNHAITPLINAYLVRAEERRRLTWYELAHDRLIGPVRADNRRWFAKHLSPLQLQAERWKRSGQAESLLFRDADLQAAETWAAAQRSPLRPAEEEFLAACAALRTELERERRTAQRIRRLAIFSSIAAVVALVGLIGALIAYQRATTAEARARTQEQLALAAKDEALAQERIAQEQRGIAVARSHAAYALAQLNVNPERALILARAATRTPGSDGAPLPEALETLWRVQSDSRVRRTVAYADERFGLAYSPDGAFLASGGLDGTVDLIDLTTGTTRTFATLGEPIFQLRYSRDGTRLAAVTGSSVTIWNTADGALVDTVTTAGFVYDAAFGPDADTLVVANADPDTDGFVGGATILSLTDPTPALLVEHGAGAAAAAISADGALLVSGGFDREVVVTNLAGGATLDSLEIADTPVPGGIAISPDGSYVLIAEQNTPSAQLWDLRNGETASLTGHTGAVQTVSFSADGRFIATAGDDQTVRVFALDSTQPVDAAARQVLVLSGIDGWVGLATFHPDGTRLAATGGDGAVREWDVSGAFRSELTYAIASPDGRLIAVGDLAGRIYLVDPANGALIAELTAHDNRVHMIAFSPDGRLLASASDDGEVNVWDVERRQLLRSLQHPSVAWGVRFTPDGRQLAAAIGGVIRIWDVPSFTQRAVYDVGTNLLGFDISPDGSLMAVSDENGPVIVLNAADGSQLAVADETFYNGTVVFSPDGARLAARTSLNQIVVFETATFNDAAFEGRVFELTQTDGFSFAADGNRLVIAQRDSTVQILDLTTGATTLEVAQPTPSRWALFHPDQTAIITAGSDGQLRTYPITVADLLARADAHITRPVTPEECERFSLPESAGCPADQ